MFPASFGSIKIIVVVSIVPSTSVSFAPIVVNVNVAPSKIVPESVLATGASFTDVTVIPIVPWLEVKLLLSLIVYFIFAGPLKFVNGVYTTFPNGSTA